MSYFLLFLIAVSVAQTENSLASDAANPYGASDVIAVLRNATPLSRFDKVYEKLYRNRRAVPLELDHSNYVGPAKQQSSTSKETDVGCGSCTTFSVIASAEAAYYTKFKKVVDFSEMELVDCMYKAGGCNGNNVANALRHIFNNGVTTRKLYPYKPTDLNVCNSKVKRFYKNKFVPFTINQKNAYEWKAFMKNYGAFSLTMYAGSFTKNKDGIVIDCKGAAENPGKVNHAVSAFGYGTTNGVDYLLIRNSWGTDAYNHDKGYFKLKLGACNSKVENFMGFIFDSCYSYSAENTCTADPTCKWSFGKCKNSFIKFSTKVLNALTPAAKTIDSLIDKFNGVGLSDIPTTHVLRKSNLVGTEFMCLVKEAGKNKSVDNVISLFDKAVANGSVNKTTAKITDYKKLRDLLGLKKAVQIQIATKKKLNEKYQAQDEYRFHCLKSLLGYWDARHNQHESKNTFLILGTTTDGVVKMN